jgi:hypothetical protein
MILSEEVEYAGNIPPKGIAFKLHAYSERPHPQDHPPRARHPVPLRGPPPPRRPPHRRPVDPDSYDHTGAVLWQAHAGALWARFTTALRRALAAALRVGAREFASTGAVDGGEGPDRPICDGEHIAHLDVSPHHRRTEFVRIGRKIGIAGSVVDALIERGRVQPTVRVLISATRPTVWAGQSVVETRGIEPLTPALHAVDQVAAFRLVPWCTRVSCARQ